MQVFVPCALLIRLQLVWPYGISSQEKKGQGGQTAMTHHEILQPHHQPPLTTHISQEMTDKAEKKLTVSCSCRVWSASNPCTTLVRSRQSMQLVRNTPHCFINTVPSRCCWKYLSVHETFVISDSSGNTHRTLYSLHHCCAVSLLIKRYAWRQNICLIGNAVWKYPQNTLYCFITAMLSHCWCKYLSGHKHL